MADTNKIYQICNGGEYTGITVTLSPGTCDYDSTYVSEDGKATTTTYKSL